MTFGFKRFLQVTNSTPSRPWADATSPPDGWRGGSFADFTWEKTVLLNEMHVEKDGVTECASAEERRRRAMATSVEAILSEKSLRLAMANGRGKISDAGYDDFACFFTALPANCDVVISANFKGRVLLKKKYPTFQEGFGVFIRDATTPDDPTALFYSNMAAVGGFYGRGNFFGRLGITSQSVESPQNFSFYPKPHSSQRRVDFTRKRTYRATLGLNRVGIWSELYDWRGKSMLRENARDSQRGDFYREGERRWRQAPVQAFQERDKEKIYLGFFAANGGELEVDLKSIKIFWRERAAEESQGAIVYAAPDGTLFGDGSRERPYDLVSAIQRCGDGGELRAKSGVYVPQGNVVIPKSASGTANRRRKLVADPEGRGAPIIDFAEQNAALRIEGDFWDVEGIEVTRGYGIVVQGSENVIRSCKSYCNLETGILIRHDDIDAPQESWPRDNLVVDCESYLNVDRSERNADGFACKVAAGEGNRFERCFAFLNSDDGFDLFAKNRRIGATSISHCQSIMNGYRLKANGKLVETAGNGNGFKLGGSGLAIAHVAKYCLAAGNKKHGFTNNSNPTFQLFFCKAKNNQKNNVDYYYYGSGATPVKIVENCKTSDDPDFDPTKNTGKRLLEILMKGSDEE